MQNRIGVISAKEQIREAFNLKQVATMRFEIRATGEREFIVTKDANGTLSCDCPAFVHSTTKLCKHSIAASSRQNDKFWKFT